MADQQILTIRNNLGCSKTKLKTLSTWGVINGFDRAVENMNACFSNMLFELQKDEIKKKEEEEKRK